MECLSQRELLQERVSYLVGELSRLYVLGHLVQQSAEYRADEEKLRQAECDLRECEKFDPPEWKYFKTEG